MYYRKIQVRNHDSRGNEGVQPVSPSVSKIAAGPSGPSIAWQLTRDHAVQQRLNSKGRCSCARKCQILSNKQPLAKKSGCQNIASVLDCLTFLPLTRHTFLTNFRHVRDRTEARSFHIVYPNKTPKFAFSGLKLADPGIAHPSSLDLVTPPNCICKLGDRCYLAELQRLPGPAIRLGKCLWWNENRGMC